MRDLIPVNTKYYIAKTGETLIGDGISRFPEESKEGDRFITADYFYYCHHDNNWSVGVRDRKKSFYQAVLNSINNRVVDDLGEAFYKCRNMIAAPEIPKSVTAMYAAFSGCNKLEKAPKIPDGVVSLSRTFCGCKSLIAAPEIPKSVGYLDNTFAGCTALEGVLNCHTDTGTIIGTLYGTKITAVEGSCSEETKRKLMETKK